MLIVEDELIVINEGNVGEMAVFSQKSSVVIGGTVSEISIFGNNNVLAVSESIDSGVRINVEKNVSGNELNVLGSNGSRLEIPLQPETQTWIGQVIDDYSREMEKETRNHPPRSTPQVPPAEEESDPSFILTGPNTIEIVGQKLERIELNEEEVTNYHYDGNNYLITLERDFEDGDRFAVYKENKTYEYTIEVYRPDTTILGLTSDNDHPGAEGFAYNVFIEYGMELEDEQLSLRELKVCWTDSNGIFSTCEDSYGHDRLLLSAYSWSQRVWAMDDNKLYLIDPPMFSYVDAGSLLDIEVDDELLRFIKDDSLIRQEEIISILVLDHAQERYILLDPESQYPIDVSDLPGQLEFFVLTWDYEVYSVRWN